LEVGAGGQFQAQLEAPQVVVVRVGELDVELERAGVGDGVFADFERDVGGAAEGGLRRLVDRLRGGHFAQAFVGVEALGGVGFKEQRGC